MGRWDIRRVYFYLVAFATLIMIIISGTKLVNSILDIIYPVNYSYNTPLIKDRYPPDMLKNYPNITQEDLAKALEQEKAFNQNNTRYHRYRGFFDALSLLVIAAPVYLYHWRWIKKLEESSRRG
ncbi:hypothetical protein ciss_08910 [Carboxydothermus islandicus]|uniref:DUF5671 domain-containing protein n=1 Tax=Carboxydothermus islandicus TaxID=661089 RepID=A0A1L8D1C5_9THEO|nr:hypothetical protein [Carboxydothermus islandicus]GAV24958.1 hypothetical protein ciss_08910 [Carboxydothermus islandicus]